MSGGGGPSTSGGPGMSGGSGAKASAEMEKSTGRNFFFFLVCRSSNIYRSTHIIFFLDSSEAEDNTDVESHQGEEKTPPSNEPDEQIIIGKKYSFFLVCRSSNTGVHISFFILELTESEANMDLESHWGEEEAPSSNEPDEQMIISKKYSFFLVCKSSNTGVHI